MYGEGVGKSLLWSYLFTLFTYGASIPQFEASVEATVRGKMARSVSRACSVSPGRMEQACFLSSRPSRQSAFFCPQTDQMLCSSTTLRCSSQRGKKKKIRAENPTIPTFVGDLYENTFPQIPGQHPNSCPAHLYLEDLFQLLVPKMGFIKRNYIWFCCRQYWGGNPGLCAC